MSRRASLALALSALAPVSALALVAPWLPLPTLLALALAYGCTVSAVLLSAHAAVRARVGARVGPTLALALAGVLSSVLAFALARGAHPGSARDVFSGLLSTAAILVFANAVGSLVGARVPHHGHLLPVALVSSAVDLWSALAPEGPTRALATAPDPAWLRVLAASAPVAPSRAMEPMLGVADAIFAALYLTAVRRHEIPLARMTAALGLGLLAAGAVAVALARPLPALPFIGLLVVALVPESRRVPREDRGATLFAAGLVALACARLAWLWIGRR